MAKRSLHPGPYLRETVINPSGLQGGEVANLLGINQGTLSELLNERCSLTLEMAMRFEATFGAAFGVKIEPLMRMQAEWNTAERRRRRYPLGARPFALAAA